MIYSIHPLEATDQIHDDYSRYLQTAYFFEDADLRKQFVDALKAPDFLVRGPILEASPPFKTGRSIKGLVADGVLHPSFKDLCSADALPYDRALYLHQDQAIERVARCGRNAVVATGTGSGKTEAFLIPIFDHLLRERAAGTLQQPGVRALLLYPMNALANDQLKRLRKLLARFPDITFGRYTGETEDKRTQAEKLYQEQFAGQKPLPNELVAREQMQVEPPHILITNYAMLEYLLLRPKDTAFFDCDTWRFIALDEAHIYDGASGIEIAMLLRRVKERVVQSKPGRVRCIATSATIGGDVQAVARYAGELFGEHFDGDDVIQGQRVNMAELAESWGEPEPNLYASLAQALVKKENLPALAGHARAAGVPTAVVDGALEAAQRVTPDQHVNRFLYYVLRGDRRLHQLRSVLEVKPSLLQTIPHSIGLPENAGDTVVKLVELAVRARSEEDALPLLPARYHVFVRALEGAFVCLNANDPSHKAGKPGLFLGRRETCPHCQAKVFELATCPRCGTAYLVGREVELEGNRRIRVLQQARVTSDDPDRQLTYLSLNNLVLPSDEDDAIVWGESLDTIDTEAQQPAVLCLGCGALKTGDQRPGCNCPSTTPIVRLERIVTQDDRLKRCLKCGARSPSGAVTRFLTGQDAPVSVLATSLYQMLPPDGGKAARLPGEGRKLLTFADSRQDAAFFAPYLERTYQDILRRRLILDALAADDAARSGRLRLDDLAERVRDLAERMRIFPGDASYDGKMREARQWLMQELVALDVRQALEGVGLLQFRLVRPLDWEPPQPLLDAPWNLTPDEAWTLLAVLLNSLRQTGAVTFPDNVKPDSDAFAPRHAVYVDEMPPRGVKKVLGWMPGRGRNRRQDYLTRLLVSRARLGLKDAEAEAKETLYNLWCHITEPESLWSDYLVRDRHPSAGIVYRLNYKMWEWAPASADVTMHRCNRCYGLTYDNLDGVCPKTGCQGTLEPLPPEALEAANNHYRHLYLSLKPVPLKAQEHTAQWEPKHGGVVQSDFVTGKINVLSCSTTFELGVDVGELQAVLMRNVPPTTANYVQRAGRAGRRTDSVAFVLTFAQRRSHDLTHYQDPVTMVSGKVLPPVVYITNEKIARRHLHSTVFAAFFRWAKDARNREFGRVGAFFVPDGEPSGPALLADYLSLRPSELEAALSRIMPAEMRSELEVSSWGWISKLTNDEGTGVLDRATQEIDKELSEYARLEDEASKARNHPRAGHFRRVAETVCEEELLGFLGSHNVLPEYGFPSDVVALRTSHLEHIPEAAHVRLTRPLRQAISDYAPGSQVVAAKRVWTSAGLFPRPAQDWRSFEYAICPTCRLFYREVQLDQTRCKVCGGSLYTPTTHRGKYIIPEFGFLASAETKATGERRPDRTYSSQTFFSDYDSQRWSEQDELPLEDIDGLARGSLRVERKYSRYGKLVVVNSGEKDAGFSICGTCGWGERNAAVVRKGGSRKSTGHPNPKTGKPCQGNLLEHGNIHLGHEFLTDVLELRLRGSGEDPYNWSLWLSLLYAVLEGASEALNIARDDLDGTLHPYEEREAPALILFDSVPGGAGHVRRVADNLGAVLQAALERVSHTECGEETSCYGCLRNFANQRVHDDLKRGLARDFLRRYLG